MTIKETITWHCDRDSCPNQEHVELGTFPRGWVCLTVWASAMTRELTFCSEDHALDFLKNRRRIRRERAERTKGLPLTVDTHEGVDFVHGMPDTEEGDR